MAVNIKYRASNPVVHTDTTIKNSPLSNDEIDGNFKNVKDAIEVIQSADGAAAVGFTPTGTVAATNVQSAINEVVSDLAAGTGASLVGFTPTGTVAATNVQSAINEVVSDLAAGTGASLVGYTPTGTVAATNVQSAINEVVSDLAAGTGASLVGYTPTGTGAVATTVQSKLREAVSVKDFGAVGDGATNDTAAFHAFVAYLSTTGAEGFMPAGTYLTDPLVTTFSGLPFTITGAGKDKTVIKNRTPNSSFLYWTAANGVTIQELTLDGDYTGTQVDLASGGHLVFVNSSNVTVRNVVLRQIRRVGLMAFNDHQTTITNVYKNFVVDGVDVYGPDNYVNFEGPSAILIADYNDSVIRNCYIEKIGLYGYEYKNDCNNNIISNCVAFKTFFGIYFGGDGSRTDLKYVKNSLVENCILVDCPENIWVGTADNNLIQNCEIRTADAATETPSRATIAIQNGNNNRLHGIHIVGRKNYAVDIRDNSSGNSVEFSLVDGAYTGEAVSIAANSTGNMAVIAWKNHDNSVLNRLRFTTQNDVFDIRRNYYYRFGFDANPIIEDALTNSRPPYTTTLKGRVQFGDTFDVYTNTNQTSLFENFGDYSTATLSQIRHRFDTGSKVETIWATGGGSSVSYIKDQQGFIPGDDNTLRLGAPSARWTIVYAATGTINTSDAREKQQVRELSDAERAVAVRLKGLVRAFKFNDAVEKKGDGARIHVGVIAQDVKAAFEAEGLVAEDYAVLCYDEWPETPEERDEEGNITQEYRPAGNRYGVRYEELLAFIIGAI